MAQLARAAVAGLVGLALLCGCTRADADSGAARRSATPAAGANVATIGPVRAARRVGPPAGGPLGPVDRDGGVSARLRDGSTVWFFGDTAARRPDGSLAYFVIGTAAWARPGRPTRTVDALSTSRPGEPRPFVTDQRGFRPCPATAAVDGVWPLSAVTERVGPRDRVVLWMSNICLSDAGTAVSRGTSVGEWWYDPDRPPADGAVEVTVLEPDLFPDSRFGSAATVGPDGRAYVYGCGTTPATGPPERSVPCHAARVPLDRVADRDAYERWDGTAWTPGARPAPMVMAPAPDGPSNPPGPFAVTWDAGRRLYLLLASPWPGFVPIGSVRTSRSPQGPWSAPVDFELPDCADGLEDRTRACYGVNAQPWLTTDGAIGIGWYDRHVEEPARGSFLVGRLDLALGP